MTADTFDTRSINVLRSRLFDAFFGGIFLAKRSQRKKFSARLPCMLLLFYATPARSVHVR